MTKHVSQRELSVDRKLEDASHSRLPFVLLFCSVVFGSLVLSSWMTERDTGWNTLHRIKEDRKGKKKLQEINPLQEGSSGSHLSFMLLSFALLFFIQVSKCGLSSRDVFLCEIGFSCLPIELSLFHFISTCFVFYSMSVSVCSSTSPFVGKETRIEINTMMKLNQIHFSSHSFRSCLWIHPSLFPHPVSNRILFFSRILFSISLSLLRLVSCRSHFLWEGRGYHTIHSREHRVEVRNEWW